ncbi:MAG: TIGR04086 family membrane protein [Oscillospiraceae bacterium]|jgi:putative membrane protein (TIGR04086 family)|nr:TIGR04086 family membrane protein [Oscillospiraceae bacterium]
MPQKDEAKGLFRVVLKYTALSLLLTLVILAIAAILVSGGILPIGQSVAAVLLAVAAGAFTGGMFAARRAGTHKLPASMMTGFSVFLILLIAGFLFSFPPARHTVLVLLSAVVSALAGGIYARRPHRKQPTKRSFFK